MSRTLGIGRANMLCWAWRGCVMEVGEVGRVDRQGTRPVPGWEWSEKEPFRGIDLWLSTPQTMNGRRSKLLETIRCIGGKWEVGEGSGGSALDHTGVQRSQLGEFSGVTGEFVGVWC